MQGTKSIKKNFIYNSAYQLIAIAVPLVTTPYLSRVLGAAGIGEYAYAYSIAYYFTLLIKLGINTYGSREIACCRDDKIRTSKTFWELYTFQLVLALFFSFIYIVYSVFVSKNKSVSLILGIFVVSAGIDITWFFGGMEEFKLIAIRDLIIKVLSTLGIFAVVKTEMDTWKYALLLSIGFIGSQIFLWPSLCKYVNWYRPTIKGILRHIKPNLLLFLPTIAVSLYKTMDKIMLGAFSSTVEVGYYESSEKIIQVPMALITSLGTVMQPRMSNLLSRGEDKDKLEYIMKKSFSLAMFMSSLIGFGIMMEAGTFVPWFYGDGYEKCIILYKILLPSCLFLAFANVIRTQYLIPNKKDISYIVSLFAGAGINLLVNILLIGKYKSTGVAIGTLTAEITVCVIQIFLVKKQISMFENVMSSLCYIVAGLAMYFIGSGINLNIRPVEEMIIKAGVGVGIYIIILGILLLLKDSLEKWRLKKQ